MSVFTNARVETSVGGVGQADTQTSVDYHGVFFGKKTGRREGIVTTVGPGPGEYEPYYMPETIAIENSNMKQTDKTFEASVPRYHEQIVLNEAKRVGAKSCCYSCKVRLKEKK